jgi:hypothetical protein
MKQTLIIEIEFPTDDVQPFYELWDKAAEILTENESEGRIKNFDISTGESKSFQPF